MLFDFLFKKKFNYVMAYSHNAGRASKVFAETNRYELKGTTFIIPGKTVENVYYIEEYWNNDVVNDYYVQ